MAGFARGVDLIDADNDLALGLLGQISSTSAEQNVLISPYSALIALQMLDTGTAGETKKEIEDVLKTASTPQLVLNEEYQMLASLQSASNADFVLADSMWVNKGFELKPAFVATNELLFQAKLASVDFQSPDAAKTINDWAKQKTKKKPKEQFPISSLFPSPRPHN